MILNNILIEFKVPKNILLDKLKINNKWLFKLFINKQLWDIYMKIMINKLHIIVLHLIMIKILLCIK
jgi:hypothetical protein